MGIAPSKTNALGADEDRTARGNASIHEMRTVSCHRAEMPRKDLQRSPHYRQENRGRTAPFSGHLEEEMKLPETLSQADVEHNLSTMFNSMVIVKQSRRHTSRAAVHPVDEKYERSFHVRAIESLPPPEHEKKRGERRGSSCLPVRCPQESSVNGGGMSSISDDDSEYLAKLYDLRTLNMYRLITDTRRKRQIEYQPSTVEEKSLEMDDDDDALGEAERGSSFTTTMIFAIDLD